MSASIPIGQADIGDSVRSGTWDVRTRLSIAALAAAVFALVFSEFLPTGLLTPMARDLSVSQGAAGQAVTATAVAGMVSALFIGLVIGTTDRRLVMVGLSGLALAGNAVSIMATEMTTLLIARAAVGIAIGGFWSLSAGVLGRLVSASDIGRAMGIIMIGVSFATIAAPPAGAFIAAHWGWRMALGVASATSLVALVAQLSTLPRLPAAHPVSLRTLLSVSRRRAVIAGLVAVVAIAGGHFAGFTYIRPVLQDIGGLQPATVAVVLLAFGISNFVGNLLGTALVDGHLPRVLVTAAAMIGLSALGIFLIGYSPHAVIALICVWGFAFGAAPIALQTWAARGAPDELESVGSLLVSTFQIAIAVGAAAGGTIVDHFGVPSVLLFTGTMTLLAVLTPVLAAERVRPA